MDALWKSIYPVYILGRFMPHVPSARDWPLKTAGVLSFLLVKPPEVHFEHRKAEGGALNWLGVQCTVSWHLNTIG